MITRVAKNGTLIEMKCTEKKATEFTKIKTIQFSLII